MKFKIQPAFPAVCLLLATTPGFSSACIASDAKSRPAIVSTERQFDRVFVQPSGLFAVILTNEDALGVIASVMLYEPIGVPRRGAWSISERIWQEGDWTQSVTSFAWSRDGKYLFISTSSVYGDGGTFQLDLWQKTAIRIWPAKSVSSKQKTETYQSTIKGFSPDGRKLVLEIEKFPNSTKSSLKSRVEVPLD